jgi:WD40 repeat protein
MSEERIYPCPVLRTSLPTGSPERRYPSLKEKLLSLRQHWWILPVLLLAGLVVVGGKLIGHGTHEYAGRLDPVAMNRTDAATEPNDNGSSPGARSLPANQQQPLPQTASTTDPLITRAVHLEGTGVPRSARQDRTYDGHRPASTRCVAVSPGQERIASGGEDNLIRLWDAGSERCLATLQGHTSWVRAVQFTPDGQSLISASQDATLRVWDLASRQQRRLLEGHRNGVGCVAVSGDGRLAASGGDDGMLCLWDLRDGRLLTRVAAHKERVFGVAFCLDGQLVVSCGSDRLARLWEVHLPARGTSGETALAEIARFEGHGDAVTCLALSVDGRLLLTGGRDGSVRLWDVAERREIRSFVGHKDRVQAVAFGPNGKYAFTGSHDAALLCWDLQRTGEAALALQCADAVSSVSCFADGRRMVVGTDDGGVALWQLANEAQVRPAEQVESSALPRMDVPPVQSFALPHQGPPSAGEPLHGNRESVCLKGHAEVVSCAVFVPGKPWALSASHDQTMRLWDLSAGRELRGMPGHAAEVHCVAAAPDGRRALSGSGRYEMHDGQLVPVDCLVRLWDLESGQELRRYVGHEGPVTSVALSADGRYLLSASHDRTVRLWDVESGRELRKLVGHGSGVHSVCFGADGKSALTAGGSDRTIRVWDLNSGREVQCLRQPSPVKCVLALPDGRHALSAGGEMTKPNDAPAASFDCTIHLWNLQTGQEVRCLAGHDRPIMSLALAAGGDRVLSGSLDGSMRLWDLAAGKQIQRFDAHSDWVMSVAVAGDGRTALTASGDRTVKLWDLP